MMIVLLLILVGLLSYIFVGLFRTYAIKQDLLDHPNHRSSHLTPVPRGGGFVFSSLWAVFLFSLYFARLLDGLYLQVFFPPIFLLGLVGFLDDKYQLPARLRFLVQLITAIYSTIIIGGFPSFNLGIMTIHWGWFGYVFMMLVLLWSTNLYNFMDGIDGIAAIEALFIFGFGGYFIWQAGGIEFATIIWAVAAIMVGFLLWNKPQAKIFMGDAGSTFLGFLVAIFALAGEIWYKVPFILWVILYGVFEFDATFTLLRRVINGDKWYQGHKLHAFQRPQARGWGHSKILFGVIGLNIILAVLAVITFYFPRCTLVTLLMAFTVLLIAYVYVEKMQPMYKGNS